MSGMDESWTALAYYR